MNQHKSPPKSSLPAILYKRLSSAEDRKKEELRQAEKNLNKLFPSLEKPKKDNG
jgi:hypothetical protein